MWTIQGWYAAGFEEGRANADHKRQMADYVLAGLEAKMPGTSRDEICALLTKSNADRLNAVPDLTRYPELRGMRELIEAEQRGIREGAKLDDLQAAVLVDGHFFLHTVIDRGKWTPKARCSVVFIPESDHGPLFGANLDSGPDEPYGAPDWPAGSEHLVMGGVSSGVYLDEESPEIFPAPVFRLVERYCRTTDEAVEMLTRYNHFWGPGNFLVADRNRRTAMIEKTAARIGVRWSPDGFGFVTAMTAEDPEMNAYLADRRKASLVSRGLTDPCGDTRYWELQDQRRVLMNRLIDEARRDPSLESVRTMLQYRGDDGMTCDNGDVLHPSDPPIEYTLRTHIVSLGEARAWWWARDKQRNIPSWENPQEDVVYDDVLRW